MAGNPGTGRKRRKEQRDGEQATAGAGEAQGGAPEESQVLFPPSFSVSEIKNKQRRHFMFLRWKQQQRKVGVCAWLLEDSVCPELGEAFCWAARLETRMSSTKSGEGGLVAAAGMWQENKNSCKYKRFEKSVSFVGSCGVSEEEVLKWSWVGEI